MTNETIELICEHEALNLFEAFDEELAEQEWTCTAKEAWCLGVVSALRTLGLGNADVDFTDVYSCLSACDSEIRTKYDHWSPIATF